MRILNLALILAMAPSVAFAQARPMTPGMDCAAARQLVGRAGAIVLGTGPNTYDRYVRDRSFCQIAEILDPAWVPTRDVAQCPVGYRCRSGALDFND